MTRAVTEPAVDEMFDDDGTPPAAPSRPADDTRIMGMAPDTWALMLERKLDAYDLAHRQRHEAQAANFGAFKSEVLEVLARVVEVLKTQERHERAIQEQRRDLNEETAARMQLDDRVAKLERGHADHDTKITKLTKTRAKRKRP